MQGQRQLKAMENAQTNVQVVLAQEPVCTY